MLRKSCSNIRFIYLPTRMNGNKPEYTYTSNFIRFSYLPMVMNGNIHSYPYTLAEGITSDRPG